ncbi:hypothetical protein VINE108521_04195 [Vibrio neonatus]
MFFQKQESSEIGLFLSIFVVDLDSLSQGIL